jgi:hypothetical protein
MVMTRDFEKNFVMILFQKIGIRFSIVTVPLVPYLSFNSAPILLSTIYVACNDKFLSRKCIFKLGFEPLKLIINLVSLPIRLVLGIEH